MIRRNKSEQQHYHSGDDYDYLVPSSIFSSSWYVQLQNQPQSMPLTMSTKTKYSLFQTNSPRPYSVYLVIVVLLLVFFISFSIFFPTRQTHDQLSYRHHRLKRQIVPSNSLASGKQHYTVMLHQVLLHRNSSSVVAGCTINMPSEGIYHVPPQNYLASQIISLVEKAYQQEFQAIKRTGLKIRTKLMQTPSFLGDFALSKFEENFRTYIHVLLASQPSIKEIQVMVAPTSPSENNGGNYIYYDTIKYYRSENYSLSKNFFDYDSIHDVILKQNVNVILQTFTASNARDTLKQPVHNDQQRQEQQQLMANGWWVGPVFCEKNRNETFLMAHIYPFTDSYFLVSYFNISTIDIDQCDNDESPFAGTHKCPTSMKCVHQPGQGFTLGAYTCRCTNSDERVNATIDGKSLEWDDKYDNGSMTSVINSCECNAESCHITYNRFLRTIVIIIQSIFIVFVAILAAIIFQRRKTKIIKHSMWILLELVLLGAALLYASVIVDSFGPHGIVCLIMPWLRELGFTIVYGTLILRIYKMLAEFQSRKAHCVQVKEKDMLRILFFMTISITGYLLGWTLVNVDHSNENISLGKYLLGHGMTEKDRSFFQTCRPRSWDYLVQFAEFVFLCVGVRFIYSTRTAPCEYHERKLITIAIVCEMLFSTLLHIIRDCLWETVHPDGLFILSVFRCHFTVTCMLALIFCTKLCYIFRPFNEEYSGRDRFRSLPDGAEPADLMSKLQSNGDVEFGELNIRDMDPEEIRAELKRLYTSLHVLKTKTMRKDNPHLTKRHGQRRKNRRFSMQAFQRHAGANPPSTTTASGPVSHIVPGGDKHDHEPTKTPEDSTDESDDAHGRTLSDLTMTMASTGGAGQRVTFK